jgi:ABC-type transport system involved in multi-copper enzyme maturation permease subunit
MRSQFISLLQNELTKAARRKLPYFGLFTVGLGCLIIFFVAGQISESATANAWGYVAFSMQLLSSDILPIFVVVFASMLVAEETGTGTIRAALAAPVYRWELYLAKAVAGLFYMIILSSAGLAFSTGMACIHYHFGAVTDSVGVVYSRGRAFHEFLTADSLSWIPLSGLVMYGLVVSTLVRSPGAAVAVAICTLTVIDFTKHLLGLDAYIFTRYITYPWLTLKQIAQGMDYQWRPEVWHMLTLSSISALVTFLAGLVVFVKRDLNH